MVVKGLACKEQLLILALKMDQNAEKWTDSEVQAVSNLSETKNMKWIHSPC